MTSMASTVTQVNAKVEMTQPAMTQKNQMLPNAIIKNGQYIVADLDGTIIGAPGKGVEPELNESPCYQPLLNWLSSGGRIAAITGNDLSRMEKRFFNHIPSHLRANNQVILIANGGSAFYGTDDQGKLVEDTNFRSNAIKGGTVIPSQVIEHLIDRAKDFVNDFFNGLRKNPQLIDHLDLKFQFLKKIAQEKIEGFSRNELITFDTNTLPRIEVRTILNTNLVTQVAVIGIPAPLNFRLDALDLKGLKEQGATFDVKRMNFTTEINPLGVDKALPVYWMMNSPAYNFIPKHSVSLGDSPSENDKPLLELSDQEKLNMPFISVSEKDKTILPSAFYIGRHCHGSCKVIEGLLKKAYEFTDNNRLEPVIPNTIKDVISTITDTKQSN